VPGKDFSDIRDREAPGAPDVEQVLAWDGLGGVRDSFDYSASRLAHPDVALDIEVDGIAAQGDALFQELRDNRSSLLFSVESPLGHVDHVYYVRPTTFPNPNPGFGVWATSLQIDVTIPPVDLDGLELWGGDNFDDSDRYSLAGDPPVTNTVVPNETVKVAIWQYDIAGHISDAHTLTRDLAEAMDRQFGFPGNGPAFGLLSEAMDVDAIMVQGERVTFSIQPIDLSVVDPLLPNLDGGEIFEYDGPGSTTRYLNHGGYTWNTALDLVATFGVPDENIDALEAASVPEPCGFAVGLFGLLALRFLPRRREFGSGAPNGP
jgi:hypothetical protein